jgi:hypothetical protein
MNTKTIHEGRELAAAELDAVSGGDKLGNTQIQTLMSNYNEAQTLASSVQKKLHDTASAVIGKI